MAISDEKYMLLTTFKRDGKPVTTPTWVVALGDGKVGFWTSSGSGKAKRLAHTARVTVQPCDARGRLKEGSSALEGTAVLVTGPELEQIRTKVVAKYGFMTKVAKAFGSIAGFFKRKRIPYGDRGVVITLAPAGGDASSASTETSTQPSEVTESKAGASTTDDAQPSGGAEPSGDSESPSEG
jgi:uncharacterized protein